MPWDEKAFQDRIMSRASALGMSERDVMRAAGIAGNTFDKPPENQGRTYKTIEVIAGAVKWTVCEALGCAGAPREDLLKMAVATAVRALADQPELLTDAILSAYDVLGEREREGELNDPSALSALAQMLRRTNRAR